MKRTSQDFARLIDIVTQDRSAPVYWLPPLHILSTVERGMFAVDGPPHHLLRYIDLQLPGIRFNEMLEEQHFTGAQRQAILVAWEFFNGGDKEERAEFLQLVFRLDSANFQAVMEGMRVRTERDTFDEIRLRLLKRLIDTLRSWEEVGL